MSTLSKQNTEDIFEITPLQEGLLFHYLKYEGNSHQNFEQICLNLHGQLDRKLFTEAWDLVVQNNEMLRAVYRWRKLSKPVQVILKKHPVQISFEDLIGMDKAQQKRKLDQVKATSKAKLFDLEKVPFRLEVVQFSASEFTLIISNHSIIYDGWSNGILLKEFFNTYHALLKGETYHFETKGKFKEYVKAIKNSPSEGERAFWTSYFHELGGSNEMAIRGKSGGEMLTSSSYHLGLPSELTDKFEQFCTANNITKATLFYAIWGILLQKISASKDVVFGTTVSGRTANVPGIETMVGLLINTLPLRIKNTGQTALELVQDISRHLREREKFETTQLLKTREYASLDMGENFFDTVVLIENYPLDKDIFKNNPSCKIDSFSFDQTNNFALALSIVNFEKDIDIYFGYDQAKYDAETVKKLGQYFLKVAYDIVQNPNQPISRMEIISSIERQEVVYQLNETKDHYSSDKLIHELFEQQVVLYPRHPAITYGEKTMTYEEVNQWSNRLAHKLLQLFRGENVLVPVIMDRSPAMIISVMGILKAGCAYVPFEPNLPKARIGKLLESLEAPVLITDRATASTVAEILDETKHVVNALCLSLDYLPGRLPHSDHFEWIDFRSTELSKENPGVDFPNDRVAYIIYTSGSTGLPKGVVVQHKPVINILEWVNTTFEVGPGDRLLFVTSLGFDLSVYDIFGILAAGACIHIASREQVEDPREILDLVVSKNITIWDSAPPAFDRIVQYGTLLEADTTGNHLRLCLLSGDWIGLQLPGLTKDLFGNVQVVSLGGATEAVIWSNYFLFDKVQGNWNSIPYGRPIQNARYYILDDDLNPIPKGIIGELFIGGECLALGYHKEEELTREKFIPDPFVPGGRIYRTGDLVRWFEDGNIELIGRKDHQVKIRGYRVELGEIETCLDKYTQVRNKAVLLHKNQIGEQQVCVFYTSDQELDEHDLKKSIAAELPHYMVPSHLIRVQEFPITANGKLDRKALINKVKEYNQAVASAYGSGTERRLAGLWADVLKYDEEKIGSYTNFFEIGGHSLNATLVQAKIEKNFSVQIQLREIFNHPALARLAEYIDRASSKMINIPRTEKKEHYSVTSGQLRIYSLQKLNEQETTYNITGCLKISGKIDELKVERVITGMIAAHESLRTVFENIDGQVVQQVLPAVDFKLEKYEVQETPRDFQQYIHPFELSKGPLFRLTLIQSPGNEQYLLLDMHHIISDGLSVNKFLIDFMDGYKGQPIKKSKLQFKDYSEWCNSASYEKRIETQREFWLSQFQGDIQRLNLPYDFERPREQSYEGDHLFFTIENDKVEPLRALASAADTTMFTVILAFYEVLLAKMSNQRDVILGIPVLNRPHDDLMETMGFFANTLALKNEVDPNTSFIEFLRQLSRYVLKVLENQEYPFADLTNQLESQRDPSRNPVFDVMLEYDNLEMPSIELEGMQVQVIPNIVKRSKFDLLLSVYPGEGRIQFKIEYAKRLFERSTIEWMRDSLLNIITIVLQNIEVPIGQVDLFRPHFSQEEAEFDF